MNATYLIEKATKAHSQDGYTSFPALCATYETIIRDLDAQLAERTGRGLVPAKGWKLDFLPLGQTSIPVEYEAEDGRVTFGRVYTNGYWEPSEAVIPADALEAWAAMHEQAEQSKGRDALRRFGFPSMVTA